MQAVCGLVGRRHILLFISYATPVVLVFVLALLVRHHGQLPYPDEEYADWDHIRYVAMAEHPFSLGPLTQNPPFAWRILAPLLVHLLPLPPLLGFWILTLAGLIGAALSLVWFLNGLGLSALPAMA